MFTPLPRLRLLMMVWWRGEMAVWHTCHWRIVVGINGRNVSLKVCMSGPPYERSDKKSEDIFEFVIKFFWNRLSHVLKQQIFWSFSSDIRGIRDKISKKIKKSISRKLGNKSKHVFRFLIAYGIDGQNLSMFWTKKRSVSNISYFNSFSVFLSFSV